MDGFVGIILTHIALFFLSIVGVLTLFSLIPSLCMENFTRKDNEKKLIEELNVQKCFIRLFLPPMSVLKMVSLKLLGPFTLGGKCKLKIFISHSGRHDDWDYFGASTYGIIKLLSKSDYLSLTVDSQLNNSKSYLVTYFYCPTNLLEAREVKQLEDQYTEVYDIKKE